MATVKIPPNKYRDAIDQVIAYNSKILLERRLRYPYIDGQTGVAQQDCNLWVSRVARSAPVRQGQICSYPTRRWRVRKRPDFDKLSRTRMKQEFQTKTKISSVSMESFESALDETSMSSTFSEKLPRNEPEPPEPALVPKPEIAKTSYEYEEPEDDALSDYNISDDEFTPSKRRKRKEPQTKRGKKNTLAWKLADKVRNLTREEVNAMGPEERKKPYMCEICFKRYKNTQGIRYHYQHYDHDASEDAQPQAEGPEMPSMERKEVDPSKADVETSAYCDFCLGDARENKKTGTKEELISCSDCGRSGHPSCLQFTDKLIIEVKKYKWQCIECKSCSLCGTSDNDDQLLFCDECDRGYHMYCLTPKMSEPPEGHWCCKLCEERMKAAGEYPPEN